MNWTLNLESSDLLSDHYYGPPLAGSCACTNLVRLECARGLSCYLLMIMLLRGLETDRPSLVVKWLGFGALTATARVRFPVRVSNFALWRCTVKSSSVLSLRSQAQKNWLPHEKLLPSSRNRTSDLRISNNFPTVLRSTIWAIEGMKLESRTSAYYVSVARLLSKKASAAVRCTCLSRTEAKRSLSFHTGSRTKGENQ